MWDILQNEINRQEYMEMRYKSIDEEQNKPDSDELNEKHNIGEETELKYLEEAFSAEKLKIMEELGLLTLKSESIDKEDN
jgi:hypothetical protein